MATLVEELQVKKESLEEFHSVAERILRYMYDMIDEEQRYNDYLICSSTTAGTRKVIRPFNTMLFLRDPEHFNQEFKNIKKLLNRAKLSERNFRENDIQIVNKVFYTIQQSVGIGFDLLVSPNSARKHVGNRFEELMREAFRALGIALKRIVLSIPYQTPEGEKYYKSETDIVLSPYKQVKSNPQSIDPKELIVSLKTTTKDRMPKIFIDKILIEKFLGHPVRIIGISQNDIQRKESKSGTRITFTFVSNLFMVYTNFLAKLEGYYYLDMPKKAMEYPFSEHISSFGRLILKDVWDLLNP